MYVSTDMDLGLQECVQSHALPGLQGMQMKPSWLSSFVAGLDLRQEYKQEEGFKNNYTALVRQTLLHKINIMHRTDPITSTALLTGHKIKARELLDYL